jgi:hypothetical protein
MMYGLKPVPFRVANVPFKAANVPFKVAKVPFKAVSVPFKAVHIVRVGLVIWRQLCALVFAIRCDRYRDDGDEDDRKNDGEPAQQVQAVVEEAAKAVRVDGAWRFLGQKR